MYRTHNCGELSLNQKGEKVTLSGWAQKIRNKGFIIWVDIRDRYGITQLVFDNKRTSKEIYEKAKQINREYVIQINGIVLERESKNPQIQTGSIEIFVEKLNFLNKSETPPFTLEEKTDGGEELRMKFRYLDLRRNPVKNNLIFRHKVTLKVRNFLSNAGFIDVETPYLIKSTPEGARDFIVPSRMNPKEFYALPQSPQTFKQLLMVGGIDKYFQIVKCFRDEDLRADRQPEFTQIDCEMSYVTQDEILNQFESLIIYLIKEINNKTVNSFPRIKYEEAILNYGTDKPDIRFEMKIYELNSLAKNKGFNVFDKEELILAISVPNASSYSRKQIDNLTDWVKKPEIGANGLIWVKYESENSIKSSVDKFFNISEIKKWIKKCDSKPGDLILIISGEKKECRVQIGNLRLKMGDNLGLRNPEEFAPVWITDFPLLYWDDKSKKYNAMHHPFTSPNNDHIKFLDSNPEKVKANAYDLVINGNEIGGGSIRIHDTKLQQKIFKILGFSNEEAEKQFGFLINSFKYGAPPHGGIAFGLDRLVAILKGKETIRDFIAFPKNNNGRDVMLDAPSIIGSNQLDELSLSLKSKK
ncbi:MAG: aspartate--tRNA ligase [Flavobacteriaceae bacterium]